MCQHDETTETPEQTVCVACFWPLYAGQDALFRKREGSIEFFCTKNCRHLADELGEKFYHGIGHSPITAVS